MVTSSNYFVPFMRIGAGLALLLSFCVSPQVVAQGYRELAESAIGCIKADSLSKAEDLLKQALKKSPNAKASAVLHKLLGEVCESMGDSESALNWYGCGLESLGEMVSEDELLTAQDLLLNRISLYVRRGDEKKALVDCTDVLDLNPDNTEALLIRAHLYVGDRRYREARADYEHLIELTPMDKTARMGLALLNSKDGRPREAMEQMDMLVHLFPNSADVFLIRGGMRQKRKQYEDALADFTKAVELEPKNADCYISRHNLYVEIKRKKLAKQDARSALSLGADPSTLISR